MVMLIGPKGSGKTHIGAVVARQTGMAFLRVEPLWLSLEPGQDGWARVESEVDRALADTDSVMIESLGSGPGFERLRTNLAAKYGVKYVRIKVELDTCLQRVRTRSNAEHIPVSDDQVERYNVLAAEVELDWDAEIDNNALASTEEILAVFASL